MNNEECNAFLQNVLEQLEAKVPGAAFVVQMVKEDVSKPGFISVHSAVTEPGIIPVCLKTLIDNFTTINAESQNKDPKH